MLSPKAHDELTDNGNLGYLGDELFELIPGKTSEEQKAHFIKVMEYSNGMTDNGDGTWTLHTIEEAVRKYGTKPKKIKKSVCIVCCYKYTLLFLYMIPPKIELSRYIAL